MRMFSDKRTKLNRAAASARTEFATEFDFCFACTDEWKRNLAIPYVLDIHEMARGGSRKVAMGRRECWLRACRAHHVEMGNLGVWPISRQLALKKLRDPAFYDRVTVNRIRGQADDSITEEEVSQWDAEMADIPRGRTHRTIRTQGRSSGERR